MKDANGKHLFKFSLQDKFRLLSANINSRIIGNLLHFFWFFLFFFLEERFNFSFGHVFLFDTGTSNGNLSGQSRSMTSIDFRPARPYRIVSASEDNTVAMFEGPPFKFKTVCLVLHLRKPII